MTYGTWSSPITPRNIADTLRLNDIAWDDDGETLVWSVGKGKVMLQRGIDAPRELTGAGFSPRGRVGYGGGAFTVAGGRAYGTGDRLSVVDLKGGFPRHLTPTFGGSASARVSADGQWVVYIHTDEGCDSLAIVDTAGEQWPRRLFAQSDFIMQPAWYPDGDRLAFITWDHPQMPWDGTVLHLATVQVDSAGVPYLAQDAIIAGDEDTAIFQPSFSPDGRYLAYISDASGWGHLYIYEMETGKHRQLTDGEREHGTPAWIQGMRMYGWSPDSKYIYFLRNQAGFFSLHCYDVAAGTETAISGLDDYTFLQQITVSSTGKIALIASSSTRTPRVISLEPQTGAVRVHQRTSPEHIKPERFAMAEAVQWHGEGGEAVHGLYYAPVQHDDTTIAGKPPLVVIIHGGPTSQATSDYDKDAQFFATRGYAVLYVNHRGSTGYGRKYMKALEGNWGVYDVEDAASGAHYLVAEGKADPDKLIIMGGSAGGYTVLQSLVEKPGFYAAGICRYGISNQFMLVQTTHKFEARYNDRLLGTLPADTDTYRARSPLFHAEKIIDPVIVFQGEDDNVVPKDQSDSLIEALQVRGIPHEYYVYAGEGHGFRQPENVRDYYERILAFLNRYVIYA